MPAVVPEARELRPKPRQLLEVRAGEGVHLANAGVAQPDSDDARVVDVVDPFDQTSGDGSIHELDDAVVSEQQVLGHLADRRRPAVPRTASSNWCWVPVTPPPCPGPRSNVGNAELSIAYLPAL